MAEGNGESTRSGYCPRCDAERTIRVTVPWQDDICTECYNSVPSES
ncbi:hypothetical protein MBEHAL_0906 [Halarchaeum acidiphilum MH1-52-1]|uniref:Small CPxCG-related zinc finger protein n=1 Tax=Halarchaeum acidiphilum MH1-52-1 TaxID=1261545 RepID=U2YED8_9EURY|nr:hypothetical protein MBEHAL_0906 [Halarchaeum acidiphilum MH1-52-1]